MSFSLFDKPHVPVPHLQGKVIASIRSFLAEINSRITLDTAYIRQRLRTNDITIMEITMSMNLTKNQMQRVNAVRDFYNVIWLSEVCTSNGNYIRRGVYNGSESPNLIYKVTRVFPKQSRPNS